MDQVITLVTGFVAGPARAYVDAERLRRTATESDEEWWARNAPVLEQIMDPSRYPVSGASAPPRARSTGPRPIPRAPSSSGSPASSTASRRTSPLAPRAERPTG